MVAHAGRPGRFTPACPNFVQVAFVMGGLETFGGAMGEILTAAQMRAIEQAAIASGEVTGLELMERAGRGVVEAVLGEWPDLAGGAHRAVVLCGPGNNGGDGFVVARLLAVRGWEVTAYLYGNAERLPPDARANCERWRQMGELLPACDGGAPAPGRAEVRAEVAAADVVIDAVFGTGLARAVEDPCLWEWFQLIDEALEAGRPRTVAVDIPSGLSADTGEVIGGAPARGRRAPRVMLTVTFHAVKRGHLQGEGPACCGRVVVHDIGIGRWAGAAEGRP